MNAPPVDLMDRVLDPISRCFTDDAAKALVRLRFDAQTQRRMDELADKCNEGQLTAEERAEYEAYVWAVDLIAILQSKAREYLREKERVETTIASKGDWVQETAGIIGWKGSAELAERFATDPELDYPSPPEAT